MTEIWKPITIDGDLYSEWYEISNLGRVKSWRTTNRYAQIRAKNFKILKSKISRRDGYCERALCYRGQIKWYKIHQLVAHEFLGPNINRLQINHKDGVKTNNNIENLEYCTGKQNMEHAVKNGLVPVKHGEEHHSSKLNNKIVLEIRRLYAEGGISYKILGEKYGVGSSAIGKIVLRKRWKYL